MEDSTETTCPLLFILLLFGNHFIFLFSKQDNSSKPYFYVSFLAYFLGLVATVFVMHFFKAAQPALLYLVPACIGSAILVALIKGEITDLFK